jgi:6-phospho-beta-glucosidase
VVAGIEAELLALYSDPALDTKPELLGRRGGAFYSEAAVELLHAVATDDSSRLVVNLRNNSTLPFLPAEAVIEVPAMVGAKGPAAVALDPVTPTMRGLITHVSAYEELAVDAATRGGRDRVAAALLAHPLIGQYELAGRLADRLVAENAAFLPWAVTG